MATIPTLQPIPAAMPAPALPTAPINVGGGMPNVLDQVAIVARAAQKYHIDPGLLWGVYGVETGYGSNMKTSSAGAVGAFQFIPSTARQYGYPLTNDPSKIDFQRQAEAAAHYLADLGAASNPEAALNRYSGGGYGLAKVKNALKNQPGGGSGVPLIGGAIDAVTGAAGDVAGAAGDVGSAIGQFLALIVSAEFWLRIGQGVAGLILIAMGLKALTGVSIPTPIGRV